MSWLELDGVSVHHGECLDVMGSMPDCTVDAVVTDPPYGLGFMGREWDDLPPGVECAAECLRVLKPGGHMLAFGGTRTWHRLAVAVEDAGFEIRDSLAWLYGSGFPKSHNAGRAIDRMLAPDAEREAWGNDNGDGRSEWSVEAPTTPEGRKWQGFGTALKPAFEPIVCARKPLSGTVAGNVLEWGTGALNIDATRIDTDEPIANHHGTNGAAGVTYGDRAEYERGSSGPSATHTKGRWPANVVLDGHTAATLDRQTGVLAAGNQPRVRNADDQRNAYGFFHGQGDLEERRMDSGGASRFFYCSKAPTSERPKVDGVAHPTVKPLDLMRWLVRLVTPPGGTVLDPFAGSGTTGEACIIEGIDAVLIEREAAYLPLIRDRLCKPIQPTLGGAA